MTENCSCINSLPNLWTNKYTSYYSIRNPSSLHRGIKWPQSNTTMKKIIACSSIVHIGWVVAVLPYNPSTILRTRITYILLTASIFIVIPLHSFVPVTFMSHLWNKILTILLITSHMLLSLEGLPLLTGFPPKWALVTELLKTKDFP